MRRTVRIALLLALSAGPFSWADQPEQLDRNLPEVKQMVLLSLRVPSGEEIEQAKKVLKAMAGEDAEKAEHATEQFMKNKLYYITLPTIRTVGRSCSPSKKGSNLDISARLKSDSRITSRLLYKRVM